MRCLHRTKHFLRLCGAHHERRQHKFRAAHRFTFSVRVLVQVDSQNENRTYFVAFSSLKLNVRTARASVACGSASPPHACTGAAKLFVRLQTFVMYPCSRSRTRANIRFVGDVPRRRTRRASSHRRRCDIAATWLPSRRVDNARAQPAVSRGSPLRRSRMADRPRTDASPGAGSASTTPGRASCRLSLLRRSACACPASAPRSRALRRIQLPTQRSDPRRGSRAFRVSRGVSRVAPCGPPDQRFGLSGP